MIQLLCRVPRSLAGGLFGVYHDKPVADPGFSAEGPLIPKIAIIFHIFAENCMKMKEFGPPGGVRIPGAPPWIRQCKLQSRMCIIHSSSFPWIEHAAVNTM